jgi:RNA-binding protein 26
MDTYDASSAALLAAASLQPMHPVRHFTPAHGPALPMRRGGRGGGQSMRGGDGRGQFDSRAKSNTTLVVENVPPAHLTLDQVNDFFRKFGAITNISIDPILSKALVSFSSPHEARAAHTSPDVIFGNRFVRIYFQRLEPTHPGAASMSQNHSSASFAAASPATGASVQPVSVTVTSPPPPDPAAIERRRLEGELTANIDRQKALLAQLDRPKGELSAEEKAALMTSLREVAGELETSRTALLRLAPLALGKQAGADADSNGPTASAEEEPGADLAAQRAKLEALKQEVRSQSMARIPT